MDASEGALDTSHLIVHVADTDATIDFWCRGLGGVLEQDEELAAPALDEKRQRVPPSERYPVGLGGISFRVPDLDAVHARARAEGRSPTPIFEFAELDEPVRMFFLEDPDGIRVEMIGA